MAKFWVWLQDFFKDRNFLKLIHITENIVSKVLSLALIIVIFVSLYDLMLVLVRDLFIEPTGFFNRTLIEIFGFFLNILIALELLENITVYLRKHIVQLELVLTTALIAVARKIIIFDPSKYQKIDLIALGVAIICLAISYVLIRYSHSEKRF
ncbi:phosphate-starvation-inducible PsiE family protein [Geminocystis sp.]|uniref:phosphate-starvation-inducible PsiE family protein n=1 Tax=Geminocystis sp. TaxID=2664100 RepID=UPI0035932BE8